MILKNKEIVVFGLGSNLGNRLKIIESAILALEENLKISNIKQSEIFKNPAMLPKNALKSWNREFLNQAIACEMDLEVPLPLKSALEILKTVKEIEASLGRKIRPRWAPREIDIDILAIGKQKICCEKLQIPHPGLFQRDFFSKTFLQVAPELFEALSQLQKSQ